LFKFIIANNSDETVIKELCQPELICLEEICMRAIKYSLETPQVPIRKFLILYQIYLRYLFGKVATEGDIESAGCGEFKDLKYLKAYIEKLMPDSE
jgi:hypothetical protein